MAASTCEQPAQNDQLPYFLFVAILAKPFFPFMHGHFMSFAFSSARHIATSILNEIQNPNVKFQINHSNPNNLMI